MSDDFEARYVEKVAQADKDARHRRAVAKIAEPLLADMPQTGTHYFPPREFRALVQYLFEGEPQQAARAFKRDRFKLLELEFVCKRDAGEMITLSTFARERGIARRTLLDRAAKAALISRSEKGQKLFYLEELNNLLAEAEG